MKRFGQKRCTLHLRGPRFTLRILSRYTRSSHFRSLRSVKACAPATGCSSFDRRAFARVCQSRRGFRNPDPEIANPPKAAGCISGRGRGNLSDLAIESFPKSPILASPLATGKVRPKSAASGRVALQPRRLLCSPAFRLPLRCTGRSASPICAGPCSAWSDLPITPGKCFPSVRKLVRDERYPRAAPVSRHLAELVKCGAIKRDTAAGRRLHLPDRPPLSAATRYPRAQAAAVPRVRREEQPTKNRSNSLDFSGSYPMEAAPLAGAGGKEPVLAAALGAEAGGGRILRTVG